MFPPVIHIISPLWFQCERGCWTGFPNYYSSILVAMEGEGWGHCLSTLQVPTPRHPSSPAQRAHPVVPYGICSFMEFSLPPVRVNKLQGNELTLPLMFEG